MDKYTKLTKAGKDAYLRALTEIGWFENSPTQKTALEKHLKGIDDSRYYLYCLANLGVDTEVSELVDDY